MASRKVSWLQRAFAPYLKHKDTALSALWLSVDRQLVTPSPATRSTADASTVAAASTDADANTVADTS